MNEIMRKDDILSLVSNESKVYRKERIGFDSLYIDVYEPIEISLYKLVFSAYMEVAINGVSDYEKVCGIPTYEAISEIVAERFYEKIDEEIDRDLELEGIDRSNLTDEELEDLEYSYVDYASYNDMYSCFEWQIGQCLTNLNLTYILGEEYGLNDSTSKIIYNDAQIPLIKITGGSEDEGHRFNGYYIG